MSTFKTVFARTWSLIKNFPGRLVKNRIVLIITLLVVLAAGLFGWRYLTSSKKSDGYTTTKAAYGDLQVTISASGNVVAVQSVALTFKSQGYVQACYVKLGDMVKAGQVLALEQTNDLQSSLDQAEANLESAQASYDKLVATKPQQIAQAQSNADNAKATLDRDQQLLAAGALSQSDVNTADYQYKTAALALAQAQSNADVIADAAQVKNAQAQVSQAQNNLDNAKITAPFDGYISTINGNPGMWTGGGASSSSTSTATQFEIIMTSTDLQIDAEINEADISKVSVGQPVNFTVDTYPNQTFTGKIIALSPNASTVSNVQMYEARISIDDYSKLKGGLPASINIVTASASHVIVIPQAALTYARTYMASLASAGGSNRTGTSQKRAATSQGSSTASQGSSNASQGSASSSQGGASSSQSAGAVVVMSHGQQVIKNVETGLTDDVNVEIKSGLSEGDIVVTGSLTTSKSSGSSTSTSTTKSSGSQSGGQQGGGPPPGMF